MPGMAHGKVLIGVSGWRYAPWRGVFYPDKLPQAQELRFASRMLPTIELNGSFYSLQRPEYYAGWHADCAFHMRRFECSTECASNPRLQFEAARACGISSPTIRRPTSCRSPAER